MALGNGEAIGVLFELDGARGLHTRGRETGQPELRGNRHGEAACMRGRQQFLGGGSLAFFKAGAERILRVRKPAAFSGNGSMASLQIALPLRVCRSFHVVCSSVGPPILAAAVFQTASGLCSH